MIRPSHPSPETTPTRLHLNENLLSSCCGKECQPLSNDLPPLSKIRGLMIEKVRHCGICWSFLFVGKKERAS